MATEGNAGGSSLPVDRNGRATAGGGGARNGSANAITGANGGAARDGRIETPDVRLGALLDEAQAAVSASANILRDVRERYRAAHRAEVNRWESLRAELAPARATPMAPTTSAASTSTGKAQTNGRTRAASERDEALAGREVGAERDSLARLDLAIRSLENAWLFLDPTDQTLVHDPSGPASAADAQMRVVEAQEAERNRLAREVHDGPAQALSNAIFQVEVVERLLDRDERLAREELKGLRDMLSRELRGVRAYLSQLRPPLLADLGLVGAVKEAADQIGSVLAVPVTVDLDERIDKLPETIEVAILRVVQEALQNVRKHASPRTVIVRAAREGGGWVVEVRDDGKGFDPREAPVTGRRSFGLQFMRERAGLIGARFEVRSRPELGTVVRMVIPASTEDAS
jgi:two-component system sensor histidine kinase DegS